MLDGVVGQPSVRRVANEDGVRARVFDWHVVNQIVAHKIATVLPNEKPVTISHTTLEVGSVDDG